MHPGVIDTPIWGKINSKFETEETEPVDPRAMAEILVPTGELGSPRDIANGVLFLASDDSSYVTGTELVIDGGLCA